jgi:long-chain acyl-CoA synthetase
MSLAFLLDHRADLDPDGTAVSDGSRSLSNDQLLQRVRAACRHLRDKGIRPGDVVALKVAHRIEFVALLFGAWRLGAAITPVNPGLTDLEVDQQLDDSGACLLVADNNASTHAIVATLAVGELCQTLGWPDLLAPPDPSAPALLVYTTGAPGIPKGVVLDHATLDAMAATRRDEPDLCSADRSLLIHPLWHVDGIVVSVLAPLLGGASVVITDRLEPSRWG